MNHTNSRRARVPAALALLAVGPVLLSQVEPFSAFAGVLWPTSLALLVTAVVLVLRTHRRPE